MNRLPKPKYYASFASDFGMSKVEFNELLERALSYASDHENSTELAETLAWNLNRDEWLDDDAHPLWDIALYAIEVSEAEFDEE
jgi:hypothetical protein